MAKAAEKTPKQAKPKVTKLHHALISFIAMAVLIFGLVVGVHSEPQIPLILGCAVAAIVALVIGYSWEEILEGMIRGITPALEAVLILMLIGALVGIWLASGTVPTLIYYGLMIINSHFFLVTAMAVTTLVACAIGSWGTVGTIGLAFMGIGMALGLPAPAVAGCVISGAYLGEIVSPLSDATNLTAAVVGRSVFSVTRKMIPIAVVGLVIAEVLYLLLGFNLAGDIGESGGGVQPLLDAIGGAFNITPITLLPLLVIIVCIVIKIPAIPSMLFGALVGVVIALCTQGASPVELVEYAYDGYVSMTGNEMLDGLLSAGGIMEMMNAISIVIIAMAFGGIMQSTGQMAALVEPLVRRIKAYAGLNVTVVVTCMLMNVVLPDQYLSISVPGQMYGETFDKRGIDRTDLATGLLAGGGVVSPLIPWNTCGIYCMGILSIYPFDYAPYAFLCLIVPFISIALGFLRSRKVTAQAREALAQSNDTLTAIEQDLDAVEARLVKQESEHPAA